MYYASGGCVVSLDLFMSYDVYEFMDRSMEHSIVLSNHDET